MQGKHCFQPDVPVNIELDAFVPSNHRLRLIDKYINFNFIRALTEDSYCLNNGRPSIDPEIFFRMQLINYLYNIPSERQLCEQIHDNLAYRWFCRLNIHDAVPHHSALTRIRDRLGIDKFTAYFKALLEQCRIAGLVTGEQVMTDGTLFQANASLDSMVPRTSHEIPSSKVNESTLMNEGWVGKKISNKTYVSKTDPDASLAFKNGTARTLKYKAHITIDANSRVILEPKITTGAVHESQGYLEQLERIETELDLTIQEATADRAYGSGDNIQTLTDKGITTYIPLFSGNSGSSEAPEGFIYEPENNRYRCPTGKYLNNDWAEQNRTQYYVSDPKDCKACLLKDDCSVKPGRGLYKRILRRHVHKKLFEQEKMRMEEKIFKSRLIERMYKMEGIISEAKQRHGLSRARYRGLIKTQIQAYLVASVMNIKRLIMLLRFLLLIFIVDAVDDKRNLYDCKYFRTT